MSVINIKLCFVPLPYITMAVYMSIYMCKIKTILTHVSVLEFDVLLNKYMITEHMEEFNWYKSSKKMFTWFVLNDILKTSWWKFNICWTLMFISCHLHETDYFLKAVCNKLSKLGTYMWWCRSRWLFHFWFEDCSSLFFGYSHVIPILHSPWEGAAIMIKLIDTWWHICIYIYIYIYIDLWMGPA